MPRLVDLVAKESPWRKWRSGPTVGTRIGGRGGARLRRGADRAGAAPSSQQRQRGDPGPRSGAAGGDVLDARDELSDAGERSKGDGAEILAFQVAMLEDDGAARRPRVDRGGRRQRKLRGARRSTEEIAGYEAADMTRTSGPAQRFRDIRDRVLAVCLATAGVAKGRRPARSWSAQKIWPPRVSGDRLESAAAASR